MLIKPGPATSAMSGKQGGTVASHNRYGQYFRQFVVPVNPNTGLQNAARARLTNASQAWGDLTAAQKQAWEDYALLTPLINRVGDQIFLTGQAQYVRTNAFRTQVAGLGQLATAPITAGQANQPVILAGSPAISVATGLVPQGDWTQQDFLDTPEAILQIQISPALPAGVTFWGGPWRQAIAIAEGTIAGLTTPSDPIPVLAGVGLVAAQRRIIRVRQMDVEGRLGPFAQSAPITVAV